VKILAHLSITNLKTREKASLKQGVEEFRPDLALMYFVSVEPPTGKLVRWQLTPMQIKQMQLKQASPADVLWIRDVLNREGKPFGTSVEISPASTLSVKWE
jgi:poly-gamma-glutamate synthesis protein (capsule biosynthesis protein)